MSTRQVLYIALLGLGLWGCRTPRGMLQAKEGQAPITPRPLSEIQVIDHIAVRDRDGMASWDACTEGDKEQKRQGVAFVFIATAVVNQTETTDEAG